MSVTIDQPTLFGARAGDPETSHQAARKPRENQRTKVLRAYLNGPLTDEEAAIWSGVRGGWRRCSELRKLGLIVPTGTTRDSSMGSAMQVCSITEAGRVECDG